MRIPRAFAECLAPCRPSINTKLNLIFSEVYHEKRFRGTLCLSALRRVRTASRATPCQPDSLLLLLNRIPSPSRSGFAHSSLPVCLLIHFLSSNPTLELRYPFLPLKLPCLRQSGPLLPFGSNRCWDLPATVAVTLQCSISTLHIGGRGQRVRFTSAAQSPYHRNCSFHVLSGTSSPSRCPKQLRTLSGYHQGVPTHILQGQGPPSAA